MFDMICIIEEFVALLECREVSSTTGQFAILQGSGKGRTVLLCCHSCALLLAPRYRSGICPASLRRHDRKESTKPTVNIIPGTLSMLGTFRSLSARMQSTILRCLKRLATTGAPAHVA